MSEMFNKKKSSSPILIFTAAWGEYNTLSPALTDIGSDGIPPPVNTTDYKEFAGNRYYAYQFARTLDALEGVAAQIIFSRNPGDTTETFRLLMYKKPTEIDSDRIQLQIPDRDGSHLMYFFPAVMKMIEAQNSGNYMEAVAYIEDVLKPKMWEVLNSGAQGRRHKTQPQYY